MPQACIAGTGFFVPEKIIKNDFFEKVGSSDEWIFEKLGIRERRVVENQTTGDLAALAAQKALASAALNIDQIDLILVATSTPDRLAPSCACMVQEKLKPTKNIPAFDVAAVCSGALFTICTAVQFIENGMYQNILVIGADTFSNITDWERRDSVFFGDGAGALVIQATEEDKGFLGFSMFADGRGKDAFTIPGGGSEAPTSHETVDNNLHTFRMDGRAVLDKASKALPNAVQAVLKKCNKTTKDIDYIIPHQPSIHILKAMARDLDIPFEKVQTNMDRYANTSGGTIPILLAELEEANTFREGDLIAFAAVGSGLAWGAGLYKW